MNVLALHPRRTPEQHERLEDALQGLLLAEQKAWSRLQAIEASLERRGLPPTALGRRKRITELKCALTRWQDVYRARLRVQRMARGTRVDVGGRGEVTL